jgi:hypothetical protein
VIALFGYDISSGTGGATGAAVESVGLIGANGAPLLTINFSAPVTLGAGAITLKTTTGVSVPFTLSTANNKAYVLTFTGAQFSGQSLANGHYILTVNHTVVSGANGATMAASQSMAFFRLFGDSNGDGHVNLVDYIPFIKAFFAVRGSATYSQYWSFDYDDNGEIGSVDLNHFIADFLEAQ